MEGDQKLEGEGESDAVVTLGDLVRHADALETLQQHLNDLSADDEWGDEKY